MSDPVSKLEVEDVLSSIRRLVSEEKSSPIEREKADSSDRLVLTPALRVADDLRAVQDEAPVEQDEALTDMAFEEELEAELKAAEMLIAKTEARKKNVAEIQEGTEVEADSDAPSLEAVNAGAMINDDDDDASLESGEADKRPIVSKIMIVRRKNTPDAEDNQSSDRSEIGAAEQDAIADAGADDVEKDDVVSSDVADAEPVEASEQVARTGSLSAKIAALEAVVGQTDDQWEPDDTDDSDYSGTDAPSMSWTDIDAEGANIESEPAEADVSGTNDLLSASEDIIDEDALRDLIGNIVREELQGALGERITRNVRKLVRREIHRALAAQDLE